ncbi:lysine-specific demethylase jmj25 [Phtheirospermum japonicum]|uniref:Lysine-specific demethylase jmj25 n=1 Tax=Phtheirospermum japonicum TaxID=374723 RepID=A0A830D573_9LAMI|nr:lysine-specific demethylase jmj25 [Phtheirospermum japonicum]
MRDKDPPPEEFRCKRTDGRQWRCKRRAMDGKTLCDVHYLQGKHRQYKQKVPESLKLERNVTKKRAIENGESSRRVSRISKPAAAAAANRRQKVSESLDDALRRMKLKKGDLHLELIRVFLKRQVEKKKEKEMKENAIEDETRELPYGVMAISQSSPSNLQGIGEGDVLDVKLGADSNGNSFLQRQFRSKNIEPLPISTMQVVPFAENVKKMKIKKCHWCRKTNCPSLIRCLTCRKRFFCLECIKERYFDKKEVKVKCPACRGTCSCQLCMKHQIRANNPKDSYRGGRKLDRKQLLHYLIYMLLPVLKKVNHDQSNELETESKVTGKELSEIQIPQSKLDIHTSQCCNKCKTSIVDYHRSCTNCSYNLCLGCCRDLSPHSLYRSYWLQSCKKRKIDSCGDELLSANNTSRQNSGGLPRLPVISLQNWETNEDGKISCPPTDNGGCGDNLLDLRCKFPFNWTRDLEVRAEELLCGHNVPETADVSLCCSMCNDVVTNNGEIKPCRELSRREGFSGNYLYCPTVKDIRQESLEHFQSHWVKGHPVIVRNVLPSTTGLCWDPVVMFCSYMESKSSESHDEDGLKARNCLDWCEVEIDRKRIFMGSLEKRTHAGVRQKVLKFKAWLSSRLFEKQFPVHYNEILSALPLPEYINPISGLLNVSVKLPKEFPKPDLGPCIYFSYGSPEELMQADYLSKLCYESHDSVNILAHATDAPISPEQINKIESLMKKYKTRDHHHKGKSPLQSGDTGESGLQDNGEKIILPNGIENVHFDPADPVEGQTLSVENENLSDDGESDDEASILCCGSIENSEDSDEQFQGEEIESSCTSEDKRGADSCGAQWDIFPRQDVPKLLEYLRRHSNELTSKYSYSKHVHPILDQNFFLDAYHKLRLKEEFDIQPWTFEQYTGEAIFIPAGCPYQIRKIKSCVNVVLDFISPENASQCVQLNDEIRLLPTRHRAKGKVMEVEKMALQGISAAIEDIRNLMHVDQVLV